MGQARFHDGAEASSDSGNAYRRHNQAHRPECQIPPGSYCAGIPRKRHWRIARSNGRDPSGQLPPGSRFGFTPLSFPHRHHRCPGSRYARPSSPIPPIVAARSSVALRPTLPEWVLSPSLGSLLSSRAWSLWPHLPSLTVAGPTCRPARRVVVPFVRLIGCVRALRADARARPWDETTVRRVLTVTAPRCSARASVPG
jgi:hypothetical protein